jgi:signal transduction histidine kinase
MNPSSADDRDSASSLRLVGETLAATASLEHLARLIVSRILAATRARRVALLARDSKGRLGATAEAGREDDGGSASREVVALPLPGRGYVAGIVVAEDAADRAALESFVSQAAPAVAAVGETQSGGGDLAAVQARIAGRVLHEVNNRLGAIQIYAYLLTERMKRAEDTGGLEVVTKLSSAVDRLGTSLSERTSTDAAGAERAEADLDVLIARCVAGVEGELPGRLLHRPGAAGSVRGHEAAVDEALRLVLRHLANGDGPALQVTSRRVSEQSAEIVIECALDVPRLAGELFAGEASELGRALVRGVVEGEGGTVTVLAADGGAVVRIRFGGGAG